MTQIIILLILSIVLALLVLFLILCYSDYRQLEKENDRYNRMMYDQFQLHSDSLETYEAMMREAGRYWENDEEMED